MRKMRRKTRRMRKRKIRTIRKSIPEIFEERYKRKDLEIDDEIKKDDNEAEEDGDWGEKKNK